MHPQPGAVPLLSKPVTAELGNITPYIIVPGEWSDRDIEYNATNVASGLAQNTGHNCIAAEVCLWCTVARSGLGLHMVHPVCCFLVPIVALWVSAPDRAYRQLLACRLPGCVGVCAVRADCKPVRVSRSPRPGTLPLCCVFVPTIHAGGHHRHLLVPMG